MDCKCNCTLSFIILKLPRCSTYRSAPPANLIFSRRYACLVFACNYTYIVATVNHISFDQQTSIHIFRPISVIFKSHILGPVPCVAVSPRLFSVCESLEHSRQPTAQVSWTESTLENYFVDHKNRSSVFLDNHPSRPVCNAFLSILRGEATRRFHLPISRATEEPTQSIPQQSTLATQELQTNCKDLLSGKQWESHKRCKHTTTVIPMHLQSSSRKYFALRKPFQIKRTL